MEFSFMPHNVERERDTHTLLISKQDDALAVIFVYIRTILYMGKTCSLYSRTTWGGVEGAPQLLMINCGR